MVSSRAEMVFSRTEMVFSRAGMVFSRKEMVPSRKEMISSRNETVFSSKLAAIQGTGNVGKQTADLPRITGVKTSQKEIHATNLASSVCLTFTIYRRGLGTKAVH